jgi:predicted acyltransferase
MTAASAGSASPARVASVDFFRGATMFLLAGEATHLYEHLLKAQNGVVQFVALQLEHHEWHGLHFWDLIQPFFMFIVGVAIPFAVANRRAKGETDGEITRHAVQRALLLLFFGWALYFIGAGRLVFRFQNVLAQLSVTYLAAFLLKDKSFRVQLSVSLVILLFIDLAYRFFPLEGFDHPWVVYQNLGAWFNNVVEGEINSTEWATLNVVSTTAHTIWGVLCGKLLMSDRPAKKKILSLAAAGCAALAVGYGLDFLDVTPIIKKVATSSFVCASGGWAILALAASYWLIDVRKKFQRGSLFFIVVGANSIFIYLFFSLGGAELISRIVTPFSHLLLGWTGELAAAIAASCVVWGALWGLCRWLFTRKIFIKI